MLIKHFLQNAIKCQVSPRKYQKSIQVCILGASTNLGKFTSFLLKQNPFVSAIHLQGDERVSKWCKDLNFCDTKCVAHAHPGEENVARSLKSADLVLLLPDENLKESNPIGERVMKEGQRVYNYAKQCTIFAPRTILLMCVPPVSVTTVIAAEIFKKTHFYHPGRIVGSAAITQVKANTLLGRYQDLDPQVCYVPLVGGPDVELVVPLFSRARPVEAVGKGPNVLTARLRGVKEDDFPETSALPFHVPKLPLAESYALNSLISTIAMGICGDPNAYANVYLRSNVLETCGHMVSTVRFSRGGVVHNCGLPTLTRLELGLVEKAALEIREREKMAKDFVDYVENRSGQKKPPAFKEKEAKEQRLLQQKFVR